MTKKDMIDFICSFETYPTMNSWNGSYGYSYNVKIHNLPLINEQKGILYDMVNTEDFYSDYINPEIDEWEENMKKYGTYTEKRDIYINVEGLTKKEIAKRRKEWEARGYTYDRHGTARMTLWKYVEKSVFSAGFNGRSGGHLVLYKWNGHNMAGTGWTHDREELEEMTKEEVKEIYNVLKDFELLYKVLVSQCRYIADNHTVEEEEYTITKKRNVIV